MNKPTKADRINRAKHELKLLLLKDIYDFKSEDPQVKLEAKDIADCLINITKTILKQIN